MNGPTQVDVIYKKHLIQYHMGSQSEDYICGHLALLTIYEYGLNVICLIVCRESSIHISDNINFYQSLSRKYFQYSSISTLCKKLQVRIFFQTDPYQTNFICSPTLLLQQTLEPLAYIVPSLPMIKRHLTASLWNKFIN